MKKTNKNIKVKSKTDQLGQLGLFKPRARSKMINVIFERGMDGRYNVRSARYLRRINQYAADWEVINPSEISRELRKAARLPKAVSLR